MFEKVSQIAEQMVTNVSRRQFLGWLGQGALAAAGLLAGVLAFPRAAQAAGSARCCQYRCSGLGSHSTVRLCRSDGSPCAPGSSSLDGFCRLTSDRLVSDCTKCR